MTRNARAVSNALVASCYLAAAAGCYSQSSEPDSSERSIRTGKTSMPLKAPPGAPTSSSLQIRKVGSDYEIEVRSPKGFSPGAFDPILRIGDQEFSQVRHSPSVGEWGLVFTIPSNAFDALDDGSPVAVTFGPAARVGQTFGALNKSALSQ